MIATVADVSGVDASSVKLIARYLREAGHIGQQSSGAGAAKMAVSDAAALLIGMNAASLAKDAVNAADEIGRLPLEYLTTLDKAHQRYADLHVHLADSANFFDALSYLLDFHGSDNDVSTVLEFRRPAVQISLALWVEGSDDLNDRIAAAVYKPKTYNKDIIKDRILNVRITEKTLRAVANTLAN
ncbi:hypothetical protein [Methylorubrum thiocyanatum]|uniref:hypothetical protein n=1 Tax=Methylorubrum thiocyanatum TaxID=47958 RepID=UPI00364B76D9